MPKPNLNISRERIAAFCQKWRIAEFSFFGSVLRDDFGVDSDVDVLVSFTSNARISLMDMVAMKEELEAVFGRTVHIVEREAIRNPFRRHEILATRRIVHAA